MRIAKIGPCVAVAAMLSALPPAPIAAQETPRLGVWLDAGSYCAQGVRFVLPQGAEGIAFGNGFEVRQVGRDQDFAEYLAFSRRGGMASFEAYAERLRLDCADGFVLEEQFWALGPAAAPVSALAMFERRCAGEANAARHYGFRFVRAAVETPEGPVDLTLLALFGSVEFRFANQVVANAATPSAAKAAAVIDAAIAGLAPCAP